MVPVFHLGGEGRCREAFVAQKNVYTGRVTTTKAFSLEYAVHYRILQTFRFDCGYEIEHEYDC